MVADPRFADAAALDFTLDPDSPALALGFEPWDWRAEGLYGDPAWVEAPASWGWTLATHPEDGEALEDGFESTAVGGAPASATVYGATADSWVRVVATEAHSGAQSLEFQDQPDLFAPYAPMAWYTPTRCGSLTLSFAVKIEKGVVFCHEWRDWRNPASSYTAGPSVYVSADGSLAANGAILGSVATDEWLVFTIAAEVGGSDGSWSLTVEAEDGSVLSWSDLPGVALDQLNWVGFVANGSAEGRFWLDDLELR
jgi:hypothetical protein